VHTVSAPITGCPSKLRRTSLRTGGAPSGQGPATCPWHRRRETLACARAVYRRAHSDSVRGLAGRRPVAGDVTSSSSARSQPNNRFNIQFVDDRPPKGTNQRDASSVIRISLGTDVQSIKNAALLACALLGYQSEEDSCGFPEKYTMLCLARIPRHSSISSCRTLRIPLKNTPLCLPAICL
jgi:hypothetical protein